MCFLDISVSFTEDQWSTGGAKSDNMTPDQLNMYALHTCINIWLAAAVLIYKWILNCSEIMRGTQVPSLHDANRLQSNTGRHFNKTSRTSFSAHFFNICNEYNYLLTLKQNEFFIYSTDSWLLLHQTYLLSNCQNSATKCFMRQKWKYVFHQHSSLAG